MNNSKKPSFVNAKEIFEAGIKGTMLENSTPATFKSDLERLRNHMAKQEELLMFIQMRNRFLQYLNEHSEPGEITSLEEVNALDVKVAALKEDTRQVEEQLKEVMASHKSKRDEVITLYKKVNAKKEDVEVLQEEKKSLEKQFDPSYLVSERGVLKPLSDLRKIIGCEKAGPYEAIAIGRNLLAENEALLENFSEEESQLRIQLLHLDDQMKELTVAFEKLKSEESASASIPKGPEQDKARVLFHLNELLENFFPIPVKINREFGNYALIYGENRILFNRGLRILSYSDKSIDDSVVDRLNKRQGIEKSIQLSRFLESLFVYSVSP